MEIKLTRTTVSLLGSANHAMIARQFVYWLDENRYQEMEWYRAFEELSDVLKNISFVGASELLLALQVSSGIWSEAPVSELVTLTKGSLWKD